MIDVEGLILPNEPLSNFQLFEAAGRLNLKNFRGVFVRDQLPKRCQAVECGIVNTGDSESKGYHWIAWYKDKNKKISFDSYAMPPPVELVKYLKDPVYYNSERLQYGDTVFCGHLCLFVLKKLCDGMQFQDIINTLW